MLGVGRAGPLGPARAAESEPDPVSDARRDGEAVPRAGVPAGGRLPAMTERETWAVVASANEVGPATMEQLVGAFGSPAAILEVAASARGRSQLSAVLGGLQGAAATAGLVEAARTVGTALEGLRQSRVRVVIQPDDDYPASLRATDLAPPVLFVEGSLEVLSDERSVAVVGTRRPSEAGRRVAARIATAIVRCDATVVSGLAVGIDGAAHAAAVEAGGRTIAVLGGGHDRLYPTAHRRLADEIVANGGAVVSEFPPWVEPAAWSFPKRNRVISGLATATIVVEAGRRSGALITARWALDQGREVFVVPGAIDARTSAGCIAFLREYRGTARIVAGIPELLVDLALVGGDAVGNPPARGRAARRRAALGRAALAEAGPVERQVGHLIAAGVGTVDALVDATELPVATVLAAVTLLETRSLVVDALGTYRPSGVLAEAVRGAGKAPAQQPSAPSPDRAPKAEAGPEPW
jgi:DNA processing protein